MLAAAEETVGPLAKAGAAMEEMQIEAVANAAAALEVIEAAAMTVVKAMAMAQAAVRDKKTAEARAVAMEIRLVALDAALNEATGTAAAQAVREDEQQVAVAVSDLKKHLVLFTHPHPLRFKGCRGEEHARNGWLPKTGCTSDTSTMRKTRPRPSPTALDRAVSPVKSQPLSSEV